MVHIFRLTLSFASLQPTINPRAGQMNVSRFFVYIMLLLRSLVWIHPLSSIFSLFLIRFLPLFYTFGSLYSINGRNWGPVHYIQLTKLVINTVWNKNCNLLIRSFIHGLNNSTSFLCVFYCLHKIARFIVIRFSLYSINGHN